MNILLGVTGSTGVKVVPKLVGKLEADGHTVEIVVTPSAKRLMGIMVPTFVDGTSGNLIHDEAGEMFEYEQTGNIAHINLARWADVFAIVPCTSNTFNKLLVGICDNLLLSTLKAFESNKRVLIAPAMNTVMLEKDMCRFADHDFEVVFPTVKKLSCGDFGLGALADIDDIANRICGHRWHVNSNLWHPVICNDANEWLHCDLGLMDHPGRFGASRRHDIHTGVDLYACSDDYHVEAFEDATISSIGPFTGVAAGCDWWYDSCYIAAKGRSGTIVYGEIDPAKHLSVGSHIHSGQTIGEVVCILLHPPRRKVMGHSMYMLHVELLSDSLQEYTHAEWALGGDRPQCLKDPSAYLYVGCGDRGGLPVENRRDD